MSFLQSKLNCILPELKIGDKSAKIPIVQGGMGVGVSLSGLATAVADQGGIGVVAANAIGMIEPDYYQNHIQANVKALKSELRKCREKSDGLIGVNIMVAVDCFQQLLKASIEEKVDFLFLGAGLPVKNIPVQAIREAGIKVVPIVSSGRTARVIFKMWEKNYNDIPDAVVVEGPKAGGHLGFKYDQIDNPAYRLERIVPEVVEALKEFQDRWNRDIPVIAAGGIFTGEDIYRFLQLGAKGVQMGTRFVATDECDVDRKFKEAYVNCREEDIRIISSPVGMPGRAIDSSFLRDVAQGMKKVFMCPSKCLESCGAREAMYCISEALDNARKGNFDKGFAFCGSNAYRIDSIVSVKSLISSLSFEYFAEYFLSAARAEFEETVEKLRALKEEYSCGFFSVSEENEVKLREAMETFRRKMDTMRSEYDQVFESIGVSLLDKMEELK
jgi:NAD(P)H-dependent flavin oxidoreductase YrpB (nitropropane dioxygenase family)